MCDKFKKFCEDDNGLKLAYVLIGLVVGIVVGAIISPKSVNIFSGNGNGSCNSDNSLSAETNKN